MKIPTRLTLLPLAAILLFTGCKQLNMTTDESLNFYVDPQAEVAAEGSREAPFQTLEQARDAIRLLNAASRQKEINVWLSDGEFLLTETLVLNRQDGGQGEQRVRYRAMPGATPVLTSGKPVNQWRKLEASVEGLPAAAQDHIWVADVSREEYGRFTAIFQGDKRLPRAKSERFQGEKSTGYEIADSRNVMHKKDRHLLREIRYLDGAPIRAWSNLDDIEVFFNPVPWALNFIPLESIDLEQRLLTLKYEANAPAFSQNGPYAWIENAVDFIDEPGEWAHNSETGKLYYWPLNSKKPGDIRVPQLHEFVRVEGDIDYDGPIDLPVKNVSFEGLTFTHGKRSNWYKDRKGWGIQPVQPYQQSDGSQIIVEDQLNGVFAGSTDDGWAVGNNGTIVRYNGTTWNLHPTGLDPYTLRGVHGWDTDHVWAVGAEGTILYFDGQQWLPQESGVVATLYDIWGDNIDNTYAVGDAGTILAFVRVE